jgi:GNAT superfamily N-acetyltransferase
MVQPSEDRESVQIRDVNFEDGDELMQLALLYVSVPLSWDSTYVYTEDTIQKNHDWLLAKRDSLKCLLVTAGDRIVGIHILYKDKASLECFIKTLWLESNYRGQGLGSKLKLLGEAWAVQQGATTLVTHVMTGNPSMLEMNLRKGFKPVKMELAKSLVGLS